MTTPEGNLEYALARVQARRGQHLSEAAWRQLESSRDAGHFFDAVRGTPLASWVASLDPTHDCHVIERTLRAEWRRHVQSIAQWHPREWQAWLAWTEWLPTLSLLAQLARPEPAPGWMLADSVCGPIASGTPAERATSMQQTALAPLEAVVRSEVSPGQAWRDYWSTLMPAADARTRQLFDALLTVIDKHSQQMLLRNLDAAVLRGELAMHLQHLFRAAAGTVIATLCHLALLALDLERLRGDLINRCLFAARVAEAK